MVKSMLNIIYCLFIIQYAIAYPLTPCNKIQDFYTSAHIINHSILYITNTTNTFYLQSNIQKNNMLEYKNNNNSNNDNGNNTFHGIVILEYKTYPHCIYTCDMLVIANQKNSNFISKYFEKYFRIGGVLHMICNDIMCSWGNLTCNATRIKDEL